MKKNLYGPAAAQLALAGGPALARSSVAVYGVVDAGLYAKQASTRSALRRPR
jgi:predicted porin